jgi:hypothetical protein
MHTRTHFHGQRLGMVRSSYGADFPQVTTTATDAGTGGAVTWITGALKKSKWFTTASEKNKAAVEKANGTFTPELFDAVKDYQKSVGLDVDGIVGPETYAKLGFEGGVTTPDKKVEIAEGEASRFGKGQWWASSWVMPTAAVGSALAAVGLWVYFDRKN